MTDTRELMLQHEEIVLMDLLKRDQIPEKLLLQLSEDSPYFPEIEVTLSAGVGANAGHIMGKVAKELRHAGVPEEAVNRFRRSCFAGDYDSLIQTAMRWVTVS